MELLKSRNGGLQSRPFCETRLTVQNVGSQVSARVQVSWLTSTDRKSPL